MSRYKKIMLQRGVMQKDVLADVRKVDPRVDNPLLSKFVNDVCLPSPRTLESICKSLSCAPLDIYDPREIELAPRSDSDVENAATTGGGHSTTAGAVKKRARRRDKNLYNLTVEIPRDVAERVFAPAALRKLGYLSKSDFVRQGGSRREIIHNRKQRKNRRRGNVGRRITTVAKLQQYLDKGSGGEIGTSDRPQGLTKSRQPNRYYYTISEVLCQHFARLVRCC